MCIKRNRDLGLPDDRKALTLGCLQRPSNRGGVKTENREVVFVPANCTSELQPLDLSVNKVLKDHMKTKFTQWYADQVSAPLTNGKAIEEVKNENVYEQY